MAAATVTVEGPVRGALVAAAGEIVLNAVVSGDVVLTAAQFSFGPNAVIDGSLKYLRNERIEVPECVISADRVRFEMASESKMWREFRDEWQVRSQRCRNGGGGGHHSRRQDPERAHFRRRNRRREGQLAQTHPRVVAKLTTPAITLALRACGDLQDHGQRLFALSPM